MASARGTARVRTRTSTRAPIVEEIVPNYGWTEDSAGHYLLVDLPEFRKEEVKLQVDSYGRILVTGERQANEWRSVRFRLTFPVTLDSDVDKIAGKFDTGILYVTLPKRITEQENKESGAQRAGNEDAERAEENHKHDPNADNEGRDPTQHESHTDLREERRNENAHVEEFPEQVICKWEQESTLRNAVKVLRKNKGIVITAVIAFSLGLLVSRKFDFSKET